MNERPPPRPPKKITPAYLERAAVHYLQRYTAPSDHLKRVLRRRIRKSVAFHGGDPADFEPLLDGVVERMTRAGLLDDERWTQARVGELHRRGKSKRAIEATLREKGAPRELIDAALAALDGDADLQAARAYARRRRLGPWCLDDAERQLRRERHLAALARQGFSFDVALRVLDGAAD